MHEKVSRRYGKVPTRYAVDCGFATKDDITELEKRGSQVIAPVHAAAKLRKNGKDPHSRQPTDSEEMVTFRKRMATQAAKQLYKQRSSIAEFPNAECRNRGLQQFRVRGLKKVRSVSLWHAIVFNFLRMIDLGYLK